MVKRSALLMVLGSSMLASTGCAVDSSDVDRETDEEHVAAAESALNILLGREGDACSGSLTVRNKYNTYVPITRGEYTWLDVAIDGNGYWYWKCGSSLERSRGSLSYRQRVKRLYILHSTESSEIDWLVYDVQ